MSEEFFIQGNEACAKGALKAGCRFFAGYPITPSTEVAETLARELPKVGGAFVQMEDEIASAGAIIGRIQINDCYFWTGYFFNARKYRLCIYFRDSDCYC